MSVIQSSWSRPGAGARPRSTASTSLLLAKRVCTSARPAWYRATATAAATPSRQCGPWLTTCASVFTVETALWMIGGGRARRATTSCDAPLASPSAAPQRKPPPLEVVIEAEGRPASLRLHHRQADGVGVRERLVGGPVEAGV